MTTPGSTNTEQDQTAPEPEPDEDPPPSDISAPEPASPTAEEAHTPSPTHDEQVPPPPTTDPEVLTEEPEQSVDAAADHPGLREGEPADAPATQPVDATPPVAAATEAEASENAETTAEQQPAEQPKQKPKKRSGPEPAEVVKRVGTTNERALAFVLDPEPKLARLGRKTREALLPDLPPITGAALHGPEGLARHLIASAAHGRYRDLYTLWHLFRERPAECKPVLAERQPALDRARARLTAALQIGLGGRADRVARDLSEAQGLIWQWVREALAATPVAVAARPAVASALLQREPALTLPLPTAPNERWLREAAEARSAGPLAPAVEEVLGTNVHRLPATITTLSLAATHYPAEIPAMVDRIDLDSPEIGALLAWARDHGYRDRLQERIRARVADIAARDRGAALTEWHTWAERGVDVGLPEAARVDSLEGLDLELPETARLVAARRAEGVDLAPQQALDALAGRNLVRAEKAYEALVCAGVDVTLPAALHANPGVREGTRCPACGAWTWVRPGHERRCPRLTGQQQPAPLAAEPPAATGSTDPTPPEASAPGPSPPPAAGTSADDWEAAAAEERSGESSDTG